MGKHPMIADSGKRIPESGKGESGKRIAEREGVEGNALSVPW